MHIFLCVWHDELRKNDPCVSLIDVQPERKRLEKVGSAIDDEWHRSWYARK